MKTKILSILALLLTMTQGAWAQTTTYTSYTVTGGSESYWSNICNYDKLLDNNTGTKWCTVFGDGSTATATCGEWVEFNTPHAIIPTGYILTTCEDTNTHYGRNPKNWTLKGKLNVGDAWTVLTDVTNASMPKTNHTDTSFGISNTEGAYKYFRFEINAIDGSTYNIEANPQKYKFQLSRLLLKGTDAMFDASFATGSGGTGWSISPTSATDGTTVTVSYTGENKVKSVTVTNKYAIAHSLAASVVGDIMGTDGNAYAVAEKDKLPVGVSAAGVVTYKSGENGIVVALQNLATKYSWSDAFTAAAAYTPAVSGQTWKLGTKDEMSNAILNDYAIKYGYITAAGGTFPYSNNYWSATEVSGDRAYRIWVESNGVPTWHDDDGVTKATECQVRPIIAF